MNTSLPESKKPEGQKRLLVRPFPQKRFTPTQWKGVTLFTAEASSLMDDNWKDHHLEHLYAGSEARGLAIRFEETGKVAAYQVETIKITDGGDIYDWKYVPTKESLEDVPECKGTMVGILND